MTSLPLTIEPDPAYPLPDGIAEVRFHEVPDTPVMIGLLKTYNDVYIVGYAACTNIEFYSTATAKEIAYMDAVSNYNNVKAQSMFNQTLQPHQPTNQPT